MPMIPSVSSLALRIWAMMDRRFASKLLVTKSGSRKPVWTPEMTPIPPALATAAARPDRDTPDAHGSL